MKENEVMNYNLYCDESCHLQKDQSSIMVLGSMYCEAQTKKKIYEKIRSIKEKHNLSSRFEIKWTKVSLSKIDFYLELLEYFWQTEFLCYRGLVATGKNKLNHTKYNNGDYDLWYYKMYYLMINPIIYPRNHYRIFIDIKDTRGGKKIQKLHEILCNTKYDFDQKAISQIAQIDSKQSEILQLADLLNGALGFYHRGMVDEEKVNKGKLQFVQELQKRACLDCSTERNAEKYNLFIWNPRE